MTRGPGYLEGLVGRSVNRTYAIFLDKCSPEGTAVIIEWNVRVLAVVPNLDAFKIPEDAL